MREIAADAVLGRITRFLVALRPRKSREMGSARTDLLERIEKLSVERDRLVRLIQTEEERQAALSQQLRKKDAARIDALTAARLNDDDALCRGADELLAESTAARRQIDDSSAVTVNLRKQLDGVRAERTTCMQQYRFAVAAHLERLYEALIERYNGLAPEIAETVLHIAAVRRVMMSNGIANTNGWSGEVLLPGMRAREGSYVPPILDGASADFAGAAEARAAAVLEELSEAGFEYGSGTR